MKQQWNTSREQILGIVTPAFRTWRRAAVESSPSTTSFETSVVQVENKKLISFHQTFPLYLTSFYRFFSGPVWLWLIPCIYARKSRPFNWSMDKVDDFNGDVSNNTGSTACLIDSPSNVPLLTADEHNSPTTSSETQMYPLERMPHSNNVTGV